MILTIVFTTLTAVSVILLVWEFIAGVRFPLHRRQSDLSFAPAITVLKPLKGSDEYSAECLASWLAQDYAGAVQLLFGVAEESDLAADVVRRLIELNPKADAQLIICPRSLGANAKVSTLAQLARHARHDIICMSDADVRVPPDLLANAVASLNDPHAGLVHCFYRMADATTLPMQIEAVAVNGDFWSQVLLANTVKRQDFALGAVMLTTRARLASIGGFDSLVDYLADDYQLGNRIAQRGGTIGVCPVVVDCLEAPKGWREVWAHQLRWARTIRVSRPGPYFLSILSNVTLWSLLLGLLGALGFMPLFAMTESGRIYFPLLSDMPASENHYTLLTGYRGELLAATLAVFLRVILTGLLVKRLTGHKTAFNAGLLAPVKDLFQAAVWAASFLGNSVCWRGRKFRVARDGKLHPVRGGALVKS